jgi:hypothetical protein
VPRRYEVPVAILRALSFVPAALNVIHNLKEAWKVPLRDAGGPLFIQTTEAEYYVAAIWVTMLFFFFFFFFFFTSRNKSNS